MMIMTDDFPPRSADRVAGRVLTRVSTRVSTLRRLAGQLQKLERTSHPAGDSSSVISSGLEVLDRLLPDAGFRAGTLIEWMAAKGSADQLALLAARSALEDRAALGEDRVLIVIDDEETLYPPAAAALGIDLRRLILVRPGKTARRGTRALKRRRRNVPPPPVLKPPASKLCGPSSRRWPRAEWRSPFAAWKNFPRKSSDDCNWQRSAAKVSGF